MTPTVATWIEQAVEQARGTPPNIFAQITAAWVLGALEPARLIPDRVTATVEGGFAISFHVGDNRPIVEVDNGGVATLYGDSSDEPGTYTTC